MTVKLRTGQSAIYKENSEKFLIFCVTGPPDNQVNLRMEVECSICKGQIFPKDEAGYLCEFCLDPIKFIGPRGGKVKIQVTHLKPMSFSSLSTTQNMLKNWGQVVSKPVGQPPQFGIGYGHIGKPPKKEGGL